MHRRLSTPLAIPALSRTTGLRARRAKLLSVLLVGTMGLAAIAVPGAPAQAASETWTAASPTSAVTKDPGNLKTVRLVVDCGKLSGKALTDAAEHNACPQGPSTKAEQAGPCGIARLYVLDEFPDDGVGRMTWGVTSTIGPIYFFAFRVRWTYTPLHTGVIEMGFFDKAGLVNPTANVYLTTTRTGMFGLATGHFFEGRVELTNGVKCSLVPPGPSEARFIT